jgi:DNA-binding cell septation regulator SpoVG
MVLLKKEKRMRVAKVFPKPHEKGQLLGFADIIFSLTSGGNGCLTIRGFKVFKGKDGSGIQVGLPSKKETNGEWYPIMSADQENEDAKAFLNHVTDQVARVFNNAKKAAPAQESNSSPGIDDGDIPF